jgi:hypothetical protein
MNNRRNYYRILHVQPDAPAEVIRTSYRTLMQTLKMHPDLGGEHWTAALLNEAFATLMNPEKRASYDKSVRGSAVRRQSASRVVAPEQTERSKPESESKPAARAYARCLFCGGRYGARYLSDWQQHATCNRCQSPLFPVAGHEVSNSTKRTFERLPRRMEVTCTLADQPDVRLEMTTENVSIGGIYVTGEHELTPGQILRIEYWFGSAVGVVTRVAIDHGWFTPRFCAGIRFLTMEVTEGRGVFLTAKG